MYKTTGWCIHYPGGWYSAHVTPKLVEIRDCVHRICCVAELLVGILYMAKISLGETDLEVFRNKFEKT